MQGRIKEGSVEFAVLRVQHASTAFTLAQCRSSEDQGLYIGSAIEAAAEALVAASKAEHAHTEGNSQVSRGQGTGAAAWKAAAVLMLPDL
jgi:hypothetical protein